MSNPRRGRGLSDEQYEAIRLRSRNEPRYQLYSQEEEEAMDSLFDADLDISHGRSPRPNTDCERREEYRDSDERQLARDIDIALMQFSRDLRTVQRIVSQAAEPSNSHQRTRHPQSPETSTNPATQRPSVRYASSGESTSQRACEDEQSQVNDARMRARDLTIAVLQQGGATREQAEREYSSTAALRRLNRALFSTECPPPYSPSREPPPPYEASTGNNRGT